MSVYPSLASVATALRAGSFNDLDGERVADDLERNTQRYVAVVFRESVTQPSHKRKFSFLSNPPRNGLFDVDSAEQAGSADTVYLVVATPEDAAWAYERAHAWGADEVDWFPPEDAAWALDVPESDLGTWQVLRVWWD